jgi:hypothetical protein
VVYAVEKGKTMKIGRVFNEPQGVKIGFKPSLFIARD